MAKRGMAQIVCQTQRFGQIFIQTQRASEHPPDLRHFQTVRETRPVVIAFGRDKDLSLRFEPAKTHRMDDAVAVTLKIGARPSGLVR